MSTSIRWSSADLAALPDNGNRYEIIDGELYVTKQPNWEHQFVCGQLFRFLQDWSDESGAGITIIAPGIIFADDDNVVPDVVWLSHEHFQAALGSDGKLHAAPDLVIEVLSPGSNNAERDSDTKRKLYSRRGVQEYWLVDWQLRQVQVYRRADAALLLVATLLADDTLGSPLLPDFRCRVQRLFAGSLRA